MELDKAAREAVPDCGAVLSQTASGPVLWVAPASTERVMRWLRDSPDQHYEMFVDATAIDRVATDGVFEVIFVLRSLEHQRLLVVKTSVPAQEPVLPSVAALWKGANWAEREAFDMFGIRFEGHPDLRRILMYEEFEGHPLRKDYPVGKRQPLVPERDPIADPWPSKDGL